MSVTSYHDGNTPHDAIRFALPSKAYRTMPQVRWPGPTTFVIFPRCVISHSSRLSRHVHRELDIEQCCEIGEILNTDNVLGRSIDPIIVYDMLTE